MKVGIISDTHDRLDRIEKAVRIFNEKGVELLLHAGDFVSPFALKRFGGLRAKLIGVYGNNDGDKLLLRKVAVEMGFEIYRSPYEFSIGNRRVLLMHEPLFLSYLRDYTLVVYGHTHNLDIREGSPLFINPGDASGWLAKATLVVLDIDSMKPKVFNL
jgi:hypothetical protein